MDKPPERTIKIGKAMVGLQGFEPALHQALREKLAEEKAVAFLLAAVARQNYIPPTATDLYKEALRREYRRSRNEGKDADRPLTIRILGKPCMSCNRLNTLVFDIMQRLGIAADIEVVYDPDEIWRHGVLATPALVINGEVKSAGRLPTPVQVEEWLKEVRLKAEGN